MPTPSTKTTIASTIVQRLARVFMENLRMFLKGTEMCGFAFHPSPLPPSTGDIFVVEHVAGPHRVSRAVDSPTIREPFHEMREPLHEARGALERPHGAVANIPFQSLSLALQGIPGLPFGRIHSPCQEPL